MKITEEQVIRWKKTGATTVRCFNNGDLENEDLPYEEDLPCNDKLVGKEVDDAWPLPEFKKELVAGQSADEVKRTIRQFIQNHPDMYDDCSYETMIYRALSKDMEGIKYDAYNFMSDEYIACSKEDNDDGFIDQFYTDLALNILDYDAEVMCDYNSEECKAVDKLSSELIRLDEEEE